MHNYYEEPEILVLPGEPLAAVDRSCPYQGLYCNPPTAFFAQCQATGAYNPICGGTNAHCTQLGTH